MPAVVSLWAECSPDLEQQPIWCSVSCLCPACIAADLDYLNHRPQMLTWTKRPLFAND